MADRRAAMPARPSPMLKRSYDIVIIGSGMGGATAALSLASSGASILIIEKGHQLPEAPQNRDARAIFQRGHFRTDELWYDAQGRGFGPGNNYNHGGNTKFYGAVLFRYRERDFDGVAHSDGDTPPWPFRYGELSPGTIEPSCFIKCAATRRAMRLNLRVASRILIHRCQMNRPLPRSELDCLGSVSSLSPFRSVLTSIVG